MLQNKKEIIPKVLFLTNYFPKNYPKNFNQASKTKRHMFISSLKSLFLNELQLKTTNKSIKFWQHLIQD